MMSMKLPLYKNLTSVTLKAIYDLGGRASVKDVERVVADMLNLTEDERNKIHKGTQTKLSDRVSWARFYLKKKGYLESSEKGICVLSAKGEELI